MEIPTMRVKDKRFDHEQTINVSDFNEEIHEALDGEAPKPKAAKGSRAKKETAE